MDPRTKIVWVAGMPRTGSMWCMNVTRALLAAAGRTVLPARIPADPQKMAAHGVEALADDEPTRVWVLKTHALVESPRSLFISPRRDPRDAMISYMRFMGVDFETALQAALSWKEICDFYDRLPAEIRLQVDYGEITRTPAAVAGRIAAFLGLQLPAGEVEAIVASFSKEKVAGLIRETEQRVRTHIVAHDPAAREEVTRMPNGGFRAFDPNTGFQSRHVSAYRDGDWRRILSSEQRRRIEEVLSLT